MKLKSRKIFWSALFTIQTINLVLFDFILWLLRPMWFDIDKFLWEAVGINSSWTFNIFLLTGLLVIYSGFQAYSSIKKVKTNQEYKLMFIHKILLVLIFIVWNVMLVMLLSEMGSDISMIKFQFMESLNVIILIVFIATLTFILPITKNWSNVGFRFTIFLFFCIIVGWIVISPGVPKVIAGPYLQSPTESSMTVGWITDTPCVSWIEYGEDGNLDKKAYMIENGLISANQRVNNVKIDGLDPGKKYSYRIVSKKVKGLYPCSAWFGKTVYGEMHSFNTLDTGKHEVSFLVINDIHENVKLLSKLIKSEDDTPYDFVVFNGDALNNLMSERQLVEHFLKPASRLFASEIPFIFVRGNHETRGKFARELPNYMDIQGSEYYYSFAHGPAYFLVLDTGEDKDDNHFEHSGLVDFKSYRKKETEWLRNEVHEKAYKDADFRVALSHIPLNEFTFEKQPESITEYQKEWSKLLSNSGLDILLSGHYHINKMFEPDNEVGFPVVLGSGEAYKGEDFSIIRLNINNDRIEIQYKDFNGNVTASKIIEKHRIP